MWQGNFRRWQKRWLAATTPGALTMHRRASKIGPSVSVDLSNAAVLVAKELKAHGDAERAAEAMVAYATKKKTQDNVAVVVIDLRGSA